MKRIVTTLDSGEVTRYHAVPTVKPQNLAHHQWCVAMLAIYLWPQLRKELLVEILVHDCDEIITGDVPYTVKRDNPEVKEIFKRLANEARHDHLLIIPGINLSPEEEALLKLCDTLEGFIWCSKHERNGPVEGRWHEAYLVARAKFAEFFTDETWIMADELFTRFGGIVP